MSSLIAECIYATAENGKLKYAKACLESLLDTVNLDNHRLLITNNSQFKEAIDWLQTIEAKHKNITVTNMPKNIGTARGINHALYQRKPGEYVCKVDDDLTWEKSGWLEAMEFEIKLRQRIGILGLKRDDVYGEMIPEDNLLWCHDIFGTCTMYNPLMLDKVGGLNQFSTYGYDDSIFSVRSEAAGFKNAFLSTIKITNLDEGGTPYTEWKKREAGVYLQEASIYMDKIRKGELSYYYED